MEFKVGDKVKIPKNKSICVPLERSYIFKEANEKGLEFVYITEINSGMNVLKSGGDTTVYALDQINISQSAWWNSFTSY